jgi:ribosomal protein S3
MANLVKCPRPSNFKSGKVSLSDEEVSLVQSGHYTKLILMKYGVMPAKVWITKVITPKMIDSIESKDGGSFHLMKYRF